MKSLRHKPKDKSIEELLLIEKERSVIYPWTNN